MLTCNDIIYEADVLCDIVHINGDYKRPALKIKNIDDIYKKSHDRTIVFFDDKRMVHLYPALEERKHIVTKHGIQKFKTKM